MQHERRGNENPIYAPTATPAPIILEDVMDVKFLLFGIAGTLLFIYLMVVIFG